MAASAPLLAAAFVPPGSSLLWLKPIVDETISHEPGPAERLRALAPLRRPARRHERHHYRLAPEVFGRSGAVAVAALVLLPSPALASAAAGRRSPSAARCSCSLLIAVPWLFVHFSDAVSLSQSRRVAGLRTVAFALVGALALLARSSTRAAAGARRRDRAAALWPGDFDYGLRHGGPALATWIALVGGLAALVVGLRPARSSLRERHGLGAAAAALLALPVARPRRLALEPARAGRPAGALAAARPPATDRRARRARS